MDLTNPYVASLAILAAVAIMGDLVLRRILPTTSSQLASDFKVFKYNYLVVFLISCAADWLQGPYIYALYEEYGFSRSQIGTLFVIGFGTSGIVGTVVGSLADSWGRRKICLSYTVLYSLGCLTKHSRSFSVLAIGRVFCGAATSILFSVFDAWMVHEHHYRKYNCDWVGDTFASAAFGNGLTAIVSGVVASFVAERFGKVAPFDTAIVVLFVAAILIISTWTENYGSNDCNESTYNLAKEAMVQSSEQPPIILCGFVQSLFESAMYIFVLMWTPSLPSNINHGVVFASFMVAVMIGSECFQMVRHALPLVQLETIIMVVFGISFCTMLVPIITSNPLFIFPSFLLFEVAVGLYFSAFYSLRSIIVPDKGRATILNFYRVPLNLIVVVVCASAGMLQTSTVFFVCCIFEVLGFLCAFLLRVLPTSRNTKFSPMVELVQCKGPEDGNLHEAPKSSSKPSNKSSPKSSTECI